MLLPQLFKTVLNAQAGLFLGRPWAPTKCVYGQKIKSQFTDTKDPRHLWIGIQSVTNCRPTPSSCKNNIDFLNLFNIFFSWSEENNTTTLTKAPPCLDSKTLHLDPADMRRTLLMVNPRKAVGPDNIPGRVLRDCVGPSLSSIVFGIIQPALP